MNSVDTFHKRLRDEIAAVEKEIQSHNQQIEALTKRLEGLKRADELSDQAAIAELLQTGVADGSGITGGLATAPAAKVQKAPPAQIPPLYTSSSGAIFKLAVASRRQEPTLALQARTAASHAST
jgi:hypothetical protein